MKTTPEAMLAFAFIMTVLVAVKILG